MISSKRSIGSSVPSGWRRTKRLSQKRGWHRLILAPINTVLRNDTHCDTSTSRFFEDLFGRGVRLAFFREPCGTILSSSCPTWVETYAASHASRIGDSLRSAILPRGYELCAWPSGCSRSS